MNQYFLYLDRDTWLHRLDARTKVVSLLGIFAVALIFSDPRFLIAPAILVVMALISAEALVNLRKIDERPLIHISMVGNIPADRE